jgi:hypothetical protein
MNYETEEASLGKQTVQDENSLQPCEVINLGVFFNLFSDLCKLTINHNSSVAKERDHKASLATKELSSYKTF